MQQYAAVGTTSQRKMPVKVISRVQLNILLFFTDSTIRILSIDTMASQSLRVVGGRHSRVSKYICAYYMYINL
jgi:hypothetical protein